ncbi:radical SAM protein [candidate division WWE3 bacterium]|uniref:Radical SAM protein n=1 Tax=candidate division WWE3 bacterium TaxID=2053526 RepID=A0A7X9HIC8_UNCKA|nr:radical SAM protein [candidate division WWE3 bacterium]
MNVMPCVVSLPGVRNYAVISPGLLLFGLGATPDDLTSLVNEAQNDTVDTAEAHDDAFSTIGLIPTFDCNQRCIYCYSKGGETCEIMPLDIAKDTIRYLKESEKQDVLKIHLVGGGEPLLNKQWIFEVSQYASALFKVVEFHIVSNGTFDDDVLQWIFAHNCVVRISYDGAMHESQRPLATGKSSKELVRSNIKALVSHPVPVMVQCIITAPGLGTLRQTIDDVASMGVEVIKFEAARATDVSRFVPGIEPNPCEYAAALLDAIAYVGENYPDMMVDTGYFSEPSEDYYCGMCGGNKMLTPHGLITACLEVSRPTDPYAEQLIFGSVVNGTVILNQDKLDYLSGLNYTEELGGCLICNLRMICHGGCPMEGIWEYGFPLRKSSYNCKVAHSFLPRLLLLLAENPDLAKVLTNDPDITC